MIRLILKKLYLCGRTLALISMNYVIGLVIVSRYLARFRETDVVWGQDKIMMKHNITTADSYSFRLPKAN